MSDEIKPKRTRRPRAPQMQLPVRVEVTYINGKVREFSAWRASYAAHGLVLFVPSMTPAYPMATRTIPMQGVADILMEEMPQVDPRLAQPAPAPAQAGYPIFGPGQAQPPQTGPRESLNPAIAARKLRAVAQGGMQMSETVDGQVVAAGFSDDRPG